MFMFTYFCIQYVKSIYIYMFMFIFISFYRLIWCIGFGVLRDSNPHT